MATIFAIPKTAPQDQATSDLLAALRENVIPEAVAGTPLKVYVGGNTAGFEDFSDKVASRLPVFIAVVIGLSVLLLIMAFRSLWIPLVSAVFNLLSVGAAYGVVTAVFQQGVGASLLGVDSGIPIVSFIPVMMFAILFGLSMDYNVFLLSRIHEAYNEGDRPRESVIHGLSRIGKVILFAGLIMASVFLAFVTQPDVIAKMFGLGLGLAILIDVLIVRLVIAPAVVTLLGDQAWWLPKWLDKILPNVSLEGHLVEGLDASRSRVERETRRRRLQLQSPPCGRGGRTRSRRPARRPGRGCARSSLVSSRVTWVLIVASLRPSSCASAALDRPRARRRTMSCSRSVSGSKRGRSASRAPHSPSWDSTSRLAIGGASSVSPLATARTASHSRSAAASLRKKPVAPGPQRAQHELVVVVGGDDEDARAAARGEDPPGRLDAVEHRHRAGPSARRRDGSAARARRPRRRRRPRPSPRGRAGRPAAPSSRCGRARGRRRARSGSVGRSCRGHGLDATDRQQRGAVVGIGGRIGRDRQQLLEPGGRDQHQHARALARPQPARHAPRRASRLPRPAPSDAHGRRRPRLPLEHVEHHVLALPDMRGHLDPRLHTRLHQRVPPLRRPPGHGHHQPDWEVHGRRLSRRAPATSSAPDPNIHPYTRGRDRIPAHEPSAEVDPRQRAPRRAGSGP